MNSNTCLTCVLAFHCAPAYAPEAVMRATETAIKAAFGLFVIVTI